MKRIAVVLALLGLMASSVLAEDLWPPPWDVTDPANSMTFQAWEFRGLLPGQLPPEFPSDDGNPFGTASILWPDVAEVQVIPDWSGDDIGTVHIGGDEGGPPVQVPIWIPNDPKQDLYKLIFWQMTSDKSATPTGSPPTTNPPGTSVPTGYPQIGHGGTWYTYNGMNKIEPNPDGEWLIFELVPSTNIAEIVIKTTCAPEPATLGLMAAGALLALLRRKRR